MASKRGWFRDKLGFSKGKDGKPANGAADSTIAHPAVPSDQHHGQANGMQAGIINTAANPASHRPATQHGNEAGNMTASAAASGTPHAAAHSATAQGPQHPSRPDNTVNQQGLPPEPVIYQNVWSLAYFAALQNLKDPRDVEIMRDSIGLVDLFQTLESDNAFQIQESLFRRGVRKLKKPLERTKMALSLAQPLTSLDPTVGTALGVVSSVSAIAIGICGADEKFGDQIEDMLKQLAILDECDALSQSSPGMEHIYQALVGVYGDLIKFYLAARSCLLSRATTIKIVIHELSQSIPDIVSSVTKNAQLLQRRIDNATLSLVQSIQQLLLDEKIETLLGKPKDRATEAETFHDDFHTVRADAACSWILSEPTFQSWASSTTTSSKPGILSLHGQIGSGKSVTTCFVIDHVLETAKSSLPQALVCFAYCKDGFETATFLGVLRSLTLQLVEQKKSLQLDFHTWYESTRADNRVDPARSTANITRFFRDAVAGLDRARRCVIVLDGLDECDPQSQEDLVDFFTDLCASNDNLAVMISYRSQDHLHKLLSGSRSLTLPVSRARDQVIVERTVSLNLSHFSADARSLLVTELSERAHGNGIWVRMMSEYIKAVNKTKPEGLLKLLNEAAPPDNMSKLYSDLFNRMARQQDSNLLLLSAVLEILGTARRPLKLSELACAAALDEIDQDEGHKIDGVGCLKLAQVEECVDEERVFSLVYPFVARGTSMTDETKLQASAKEDQELRLAHQSIKQFVLSALPSCLDGGDAGRSSTLAGRAKHKKPQYIENRKTDLEGQLMTRCIRYLLIDEFNVIETEVPSNEEFFRMASAVHDEQSPDAWLLGIGTGDEAQKQDTAPASRVYDPAALGFGKFFAYAAAYWLSHLQQGPASGVPSAQTQCVLSQRGSRRLHNWVEQRCRPNCTVASELLMDANTLDPLVVAAEFGTRDMLSILLRDGDVLDRRYFMEQTLDHTIQHTLQDGNLRQLGLLFNDAKLKPQMQSLPFFVNVIDAWSRDGDRDEEDQSQAWRETFSLIQGVDPQVMIRDQWANEVFAEAAGRGCMPMLTILVGIGRHHAGFHAAIFADVKREGWRHQSIGEALKFQHEDAFNYLLDLGKDIEAHLHSVDYQGQNVFHLAAKHWPDPRVVEKLADRWPEGICAVSNAGDTPLGVLVFDTPKTQGRADSAEILLKHGASVTGEVSHDGEDKEGYMDSLRVAVRAFDERMCKVLVKIGGADPMSALVQERDGPLRLKDSVQPPISPEELKKMQESMVSLLVSLEKERSTSR